MPSTELEDAQFTHIDWDEQAGRRLHLRRRTVGFVLVIGALAALLAYDFVVAPDELIAALHWDPTRMDWLTLTSLVVFGRYAVTPMVVNRRRTVRYAREFLSRPAGVLSLGTLLFLAAFALVGPVLFDQGYPRLAHRLQPPAFASFDTSDLTIIYQCVGPTSDSVCHGTLAYLLGTTRIGEDVALLVSQGIGVALMLGFAAGMVMAIVATAVGTVAGYYGGLIDDLLMRYVEIQQTIPAIVVFVIFATMFLGELSGVTQGGLFALALVFGLLDWGGIARLVRSEVLSRRSAGYVRAAKAAGGSDLHVVRRHLIPNSTATIVTALTRRIPLLILAQTALVYLGVHRVGSKSLGRTLVVGLQGSHAAWYQKWWVTTFAVVALVLLVVSFNVFGDVVRDVIDPRSEVE